MFKQSRPFKRRLFHSWALAFVVVLSCVDLASARSAGGANCLRIDHVNDSPGVWTGIIATEQWLDASVIQTSQKDLRVGQHVHFGIYLVEGNKLMDKSKPQLNPTVIHAGVRITIRCQALKEDGSIYDPKCVEKGCSQLQAGAEP